MPKEGKIRFGWKVFRKEYYRLCSVTQSEVYFEIGCMTYRLPGWGPFTIYTNLRMAKQYATDAVCSGATVRLFKCAYKLSSERVVRNGRGESVLLDVLRDAFASDNPDALVLADWVVPLEEVEFKQKE